MTYIQQTKPLPSQERLVEEFYYDGEHLRNKKNKRGRGGGIDSIVGKITTRKQPRRMVKVDGIMYYHARLVWKYHHGIDPQYEIDHINNDTLDDRIENLRDIPHEDNQLNRIDSKRNKA